MTLMGFLTILGQVNLEGFDKAAEMNTLFAVLVSVVVALFGILLYVFKLYVDGNSDKKTISETHKNDIITLQKNHSDKIDEIRKESLIKIDEIRKEYMQKEEERNRYQRETEKETLSVLRGVNNVLELSEKMKESDTHKIIQAVNALQKSIESKNENR